MQEKDIKRKLNQELDEMAPDILNKILAHPIERVESEKELFGKDKPLFKEKRNISRFIYAPLITAVAACFVFVIFFMQNKPVDTNVAFSLIIDVNPSITIDIDDDGDVKEVIAGNEDAKSIVAEVNARIDENASYEEVLSVVVDELDEAGYLKKKDKVMLMSVVADNDEIGKAKVVDVKKNTDQYTKDNNIKCKPVYHNCVVTEEIEEVAQKNNISVGKAAFAMKVAKKENTNVDQLCNETVDVLVEHAENSGMAIDNVVVDETAEVGVIIGEPAVNETTEETSSVLETEEVTSYEIETSFEVETTTVIEETTTIQQGGIVSEGPASGYQQ